MGWFTKTEGIPEQQYITPADELEVLRQARRQAKTQFDADWKALQKYLSENPAMRNPFILNDRFFSPVNFLADVSPAQRELEVRLSRSKATWNKLQAQEADLLLRLGIIK